MFKLALVLCLLFVLTYADKDEEWKQFKKNHKKGYKNKNEETSRRKNWENNLDKIKKHNEAYKKGMSSYTMGENEYSDLSPEEALEKLTGFIAPDDIAGNNYQFPLKRAEPLPSSVDYRTGGFVTPVKKQGPCRACWSFAATGALEAQVFKKHGKLVSLSQQNLIDCVYSRNGCIGGWSSEAYTYVQKYGVATADSYPYTGVNGTCKYNSATVGARVLNITKIQSGNEAALLDAVANQGPVSIAFYAAAMFSFYKSGVFSDCIDKKQDHEMLVIGYGTDPLYGPFWLVKNSWGTTWGESGYGRIARNQTICGIAKRASYPTIQ